MTLGSLFDGIGGWQLAAVHAGVKPLWSSEIEKFPCAVTAKHFSDTKQLGDITKIDTDELEPVDIVCAGSPCQDLSVAGKREGLQGARSGLFMDAIRLVRELRRRTGKPRYFVWENVPGAFSSNKGMDFRAVLEEISETEIPMPEGGKWANAGVVEWGEGSLGWRVLDAQYWGVPQRRKRIFLVADFAGRSAGEILFEPEGLPRDSEESRNEGKDTAERTGNGVEGASECVDGTVIYDMTHADEVIRTIHGDKTNCLNSRKNGGNQLGIAKDISYTLNTMDRHAVAIGNGQLNQLQLSNKAGALNCMHDQQCVMYTNNQFGGYASTDTAQTLKASGGDIGGGSENLVLRKTVRRLTPLECERLQGLPDGYTLIDDKSCSDSARYKALGNGMAQPCADYVIQRIMEAANDSSGID